MNPEKRRFYQFDPFLLDVDECRLLRKGRPVPLKPKLLETLIVLVENRGHMLNTGEVMKRLWPDSFVEEANLTVNISQLRKALAENGDQDQYIETVPKHGYRFVAPVREIWEPADLIVRERTRARIVIEEHETDSDGEVQRTIDGLATRVEATPARTLPQTSRAATNPIAWIKQSTMLSRIVAAALVVAIAVVGYLIASRRGPKPQPTPLSPNSLARSDKRRVRTERI